MNIIFVSCASRIDTLKKLLVLHFLDSVYNYYKLHRPANFTTSGTFVKSSVFKLIALISHIYNAVVKYHDDVKHIFL